MAGKGRCVAVLTLAAVAGLLAGCDSKSETKPTLIPRACRFISRAEATEATGQSMKEMTPTGGANRSGTLCEYEGTDPTSTASLSVSITKGDIPHDLPAEGTVVDSTNVDRYPGLGLPAGSQLERTVVHVGRVGGVPAGWYQFTAKVPDAPSNLFLLAFPEHYKVFVSAASTADDVAAAQSAAATVINNLP